VRQAHSLALSRDLRLKLGNLLFRATDQGFQARALGVCSLFLCLHLVEEKLSLSSQALEHCSVEVCPTDSGLCRVDG
jgi:hypothetical protein